MKGKKSRNTQLFEDTAYVNSETYFDYLFRLKKIALSIFEWVNLPKSMNAEFLEKSLYYFGMASMLYTKEYGFINTNCAGMDGINLYDLPNKLNCFSNVIHFDRLLYTGLNKETNDESEAILVRNNLDNRATAKTLELFALRLYEAERTCDVNIKAQKTPVMVLVSENQRLLMENLYSQYDGNKPFIFGDKEQLGENALRAINTNAPFVADKVQEYKKEIWNEALTFLGINNIMIDKKERLITDEANSNNELINLNLQSYFAPRQKACEQFNEKFKLKGTEKEISVRVRSDLHNIIKQQASVVNDYNKTEEGGNIE